MAVKREWTDEELDALEAMDPSEWDEEVPVERSSGPTYILYELRLNGTEIETAERLAGEYGLTLSNYVRSAVLGRLPTPVTRT